MDDMKPGSLAQERGRLASRLKETREYVGLSQEEVASITGLSRAAISAIETGRRKVESLELKALAAAYRQPVHFFLDPASLGAEARDEEIEHIARAAQDLSEDDRAELLRFAQFLRSYTVGEGP